MKVLITGANGFIGKNLVAHLSERSDVSVAVFTRQDDFEKLVELIQEADFVFHLAGVNRPQNIDEFKIGNADLTEALCKAISENGKCIPVLYTSSIQAELQNPYAESKRAAEDALLELSRTCNLPVYLFRLPNVFGKWARPNYNSVVATFCHNISHNLPIQIDDPDISVPLVYIDDVISRFINFMDENISEENNSGKMFWTVEPQYLITLGELAKKLYSFRDGRDTLIVESVGKGLVRALYSTYVSYFNPEQFLYEVPKYADERGTFVEMLKTRDSGQFSFFTAHPGVTRGGHYHHSKTEKFLVVKGKARFGFRHILTNETYEIFIIEDTPKIVETVPGWVHDITNVGDDEMIVMLWANEIFDENHPDTYASLL